MPISIMTEAFTRGSRRIIISYDLAVIKLLQKRVSACSSIHGVVVRLIPCEMRAADLGEAAEVYPPLLAPPPPLSPPSKK